MKDRELLKRAMTIVEDVSELDLESIEDSGNFDDLRFLIKDSRELITESLKDLYTHKK